MSNILWPPKRQVIMGGGIKGRQLLRTIILHISLDVRY